MTPVLENMILCSLVVKRVLFSYKECENIRFKTQLLKLKWSRLVRAGGWG